MTAPVGPPSKDAPNRLESAPRNTSYSKSLLADFGSLLRSLQGGGVGACLQSSCNQQMPYSHAAGVENRGSAESSPRPGPSMDGAALVDPLALVLASPAAAASPVMTEAAPTPSVASVPGSAGGLDAVLAAEVVTRVAWGGDRRRGVARLELGGELAGAVVVVRGEGREISLELSIPEGSHAAGLPERLSARLAARGLVVREVVVR